MPSKNSLKKFEADTAYHVYNRGVDKKVIFCDERDYAVFLSFLKYALSDEMEEDFDSSRISDAQRFNFRRLNLAKELDLLAFCLMPNHFHLLLFQHSPDGVTRLMRSIATAYSVYFNKRYKRSGTLFQGRYKASAISNHAYWQHIGRYIHLNPIDMGVSYKTYKYSSYPIYANDLKVDWVKKPMITGGYSNLREFEEFHDQYIPVRHELLDVKDIIANR